VTLRPASIRFEEWVIIGVTAVVCVLVLAPIAVVFWQSVQGGDWSGPLSISFANYVTAATEPRLFRAIVNTIVASVGCTIVATVIGVTLAWLVARTNMPFRRFFGVTNPIPMFLSPFVGAIAWMALAAPRAGYLNRQLSDFFGLPPDVLNIYGLGGIIWVQGIFFTPLVYLMTVGSLRQMDPALEESSRSCGAGMLATTFRITLMLSTPSILSGMILTFVSSAGEFGVPLALGSPYGVETLSTQIFEVLQRADPNYALAAAIGSLLLASTVALVVIHRTLVSSKQFVTITGKGFRPRVADLRHWRYPALLLNVAYLLVSVVLPVGILAVMSVHKVWLGTVRWGQFTAANYTEVLLSQAATQRGIFNSLFLAIVGATVAVAISLLLSQAIYRSRLPGRRWIDMVTSLPVGIPGIVLAMGMLVLFIRTPLYGTLVLLLIAYVIRFMPVGQRSVAGSLLAMSPELEESSRACGRGWLGTMRRITLPLLKPGLAAAWVLLFTIYVRELPISILLWSSGNEVMSVVLYQLLEHGTAGQTGAYAVVQTAIALVVAVAFDQIIGSESAQR
jgi:iron(III) transport system permease protein